MQLHWFRGRIPVTKEKARTVPCVRQVESHGFSVPLANRMQALPVEGDEPQERGKSSLRSGLPSP